MAKQQVKEKILARIEDKLDLGGFIAYDQAWGFVSGLEEVETEIDSLREAGQPEVAVELYESFLGGCYEKAEEIDDSGGELGMFFHGLFCGWIQARQDAGLSAAETVERILKWEANDDYGFCYDMEERLAKTLDREGFRLYQKHFEEQLNEAYQPHEGDAPMYIRDYPHEIWRTADVLKRLYMARKDVRSYLALCQRILASPKDCENIVRLLKSKGKAEDALAWAEKGLAIEGDRQWGNESSSSLGGLREELLQKTGRGDEALQSAWDRFRSAPSAYEYRDMMKYVSTDEKDLWREKAMKEAEKGRLSGYVELCCETKEWGALAGRVHQAAHEDL